MGCCERILCRRTREFEKKMANKNRKSNRKRMNKHLHTKGKYLIILMTLMSILCCAGKAVAQATETWAASTNHSADYSANTTITVTGTPINITGTIVIKNNATVTIKVGSSVSGDVYIRRRFSDGDTSAAMFKVEEGSTLIIQGNNQIELRGGTAYTNDDARITSTPSHSNGMGVIINAAGNVTLNKLKILNNYNTDGGVIQCSTSTAQQTLTMTDVDIFASKSVLGSALYFATKDNHVATLTRVNIYKCYAYSTSKAGTIRTYGDSKTQLTLNNCDIHDNWSDARGGGIYWNAGGSDDALLTIKGDTKIRDNKSRTSTTYSQGGGIFLTGGMDLQSATISGNEAKYGGGIYMDTYDGGVSQYNGQAFDFTMKSGVTISGNTATTMGGGVMLRIRSSSDVGYNSSGGAVNVTFKFDMQGGSITGNKAPQGAGVAIDDDAPQKVKYNSKESGFYYRDVKISGGSIYSNTTTGTSNVRGGGVYIYKHVTTGNQASSNFGDIPIAISGGAIYSNTATIASGTSSVTNGSGGGVYILNAVTTGYTSTCSVTVSGSAQVYGNSCTYAGGGIYLNGGTFTMTGGHVGQTSVGTASGNSAAYGGGFYIDGGSCTIQGGNIVNNTASSNGGGFYVEPGSGVTTTINSSSGATKVNSNQAVNGGGAYIATGTLTVSGGSGTQINSNTASTSGGGLYVNGGTVSLSSATVNSNTATSGNGGGVYAAKNVTVTSSTLSGNKATNSTNGKGGGIFATGSGTVVSITGTSSSKSTLTSNQARLGGGVYADTGGSVTVDYGTIGNTSAANTASADGGGIYAIGTVTLNTGAVIQCNTASNDGGGVYVNNATFTMNDGTIGGSSASYGNKATNGSTGGGNGGGVYVTGANAKVEVKGGTIIYNSAPSTTTGKGNGGGIYVASTGSAGTALSGSAKVSYNTAKQNGGGIYVVSGKVSLTGTSTSVYPSINNNTAETTNGGGVYLGGGEFILGNYSTIVANKADAGNGGGVYVTGTAPIYRQNGNGNTEVKQNTAKKGAGIYMGAGTCYISAGYIHDNDASVDGGGMYVSGGEVVHTGGEIGRFSSAPNTAVNGAGLYMDGGKYTSSGGFFNGNTASGKGGGIYMHGGKCYFTGGKLGYDTSTMRNTAAYGGGLYMASSAKAAPEFYMSSSTSYIRGNHATNDGGAIYMEGGTCEISAGDIGHVDYPNDATNGGGIYANGGTITVTGGYLQYNQASDYGGGIYANNGSVEVNYATASVGSVRYNYAGLAGGGLYISSTGSLNLKGKATLTKNHVPLGSVGGGVYLLGTVQAGDSSSDIITVVDNYAANENDPTSYTPVPETRNNIYLPAPVDTQTTDVITIVTNGLDLTNSKVGFSVPGNFLPVIYCSNNSYLNTNQTAIINAVFEDSERYEARYFPSSLPTYSPYYIYLAADTWVQQVTTQPAGYSESGLSVTISSEQGLAWLISKVNGLNGQTGTSQDDYSGKTITLTKDLDMSDYAWVPIGMTGCTSPKAFKGTFDGGGHLIKGILCSYLGNNDAGTGQNLGLFGVVDGAVIHDVFLEESSLSFVDNSVSTTINLGGLASSGSATIYNCTASSTMNSNNNHTVMGGLIGQLTSGTIHSSAAMPTMTGYTMGGLAGTNAGNIYNSFANPKYTYSGSGSDFVGGLVAENSGTIQNCYVRFSQPSTLGSAKFGQLVGKTSNANVTICYHPTTYASGISANLVYPGSGSVSSTIYGDVVAPYLYYHDNDNLVGSTSETLCNKLNDWLASHSGYSPWKRTKAGDYSANAGNINGDYPIHKHANYTCAASTSGVNLDYATSLDVMLTRHTSDATINLYAHDNTSKGTGNNEMVYIDENISLLQSTSNAITAYTCQTLPGNTRSWHFVSSSLSNSGIGFVYGQYSAFNWDPNPCHVTMLQGNDDATLFPSDLPLLGDYADVARIDLYAFYEPEYHWINLKRRSDSHWHMNNTSVPIVYNNETTLTPGKGYLVSIDQDQLLQNRGTLNNDDVEVSLDYTPANAWAGLLGYNLIGNPYQSYLDFRRFASQNNTLWYDNSKGKAVEPTYAVYDEAMGGYIQYKEGASRGSKSAPDKLNMHQGFMVKSYGTTVAKFTNAMRTNDGAGVTFRDEQPAYPLINITVTDDEGVNDFAVLELDRNADAGAEKLRANDSKGWIYLRYNNEDYGILFRTGVENYQALWFEAEEEGTYTLSWETANAEFEALTLVDNITGVMTDMLTNDSYTFEATPDQYASRFKIVIGEYKDIEENEGDTSTTATFAFMMGDELVVNGEGHLEIMDVTGRVLQSTTLYDFQNRVSKPTAAAGVYVLRLTDDKGTKVQKMVIE
jgi:hypothetical protein